MSINSRSKGKRAELEVVHHFNAGGFDCWRTPNSGGLSHSKGDINGVPGLHIEVKNVQQVRIQDWIAQAEGDCTAIDVPVVVWRTTRHPWRVDIALEEFIPIWKIRTTS